MPKPLSHIPDHAEEAIDEAISKLVCVGGSMEALFRAFSTPVQSLEDLMLGVSAENSIDAGSGVTLDIWGRLVGEPRGGLNDATYRRIIKGKVRASRSDGTYEYILALFRLLVGENGEVELRTTSPATLLIVYKRGQGLSMTMRQRIAYLVRLALPLGVQIDFLSVAVESGFQFGGVGAGKPAGSVFGGLGACSSRRRSLRR